MISKYVEIGDKLELVMVERMPGTSEEMSKRVYTSKINEILSEDQLEILMPMEKTKLILLPVDTEYDMSIYTDNDTTFGTAHLHQSASQYEHSYRN